MHHSGFVNIIGRPNVGKSTLMNALVGEKISIITPKAQTTRHRIIGVLNNDNYQIVFSDTPGMILDPKNALHRAMIRSVITSLEDADLILFMTDIFEKINEVSGFLNEMSSLTTPKILIINKVDLLKGAGVEEQIESWKKEKLFNEIIGISALLKSNIGKLVKRILKYLPEHPPYYPKETLTDRNVRYFVSEIIREKIFNFYKQEIPYACEVIVTEYQEDKNIDRIRAEIFVERNSQKAILIGQKGSALKKVGSAAREDIEVLVEKKVYLELFVKVKGGWRDDERMLKNLGYTS